ncbi:outer membrane beta-barrel protein [Mangrovimonas sp. YM274]|uniref:outer membrane beta-barrel protein n=1 Tax=Mangrovimonas sp. YM274 TaxID=3070660 RepID=UPI0027DD1476|nr:outer membrane beta-barrel protein [Mangrovimonas sp. YM274]WMI68064.1 outer membrane beta-barrel protein [Mangrovimonas sp. YM274]
MKTKLFTVVGLLLSGMSFAQLQISASGGYAIGSAEMKLGEKVNTSSTENSYGSYGEGVNFQLRGTYFFNEHFGADLGFGYLHGADQTVSKVNLPNLELDAIARARAYGASLSMVYRFSNNIYGRFGALIKVGGKTEAVVHQKSVFSAAEATALNLPEGSYSETNYVEDFHGKFPLGFVGALGYKFEVSPNISLFAEAEYYGISLKRKDSELAEFNTNIVLPDGTVAVEGYYNLDNLPAGYSKKTTYVDELPNDNTDPSRKLAQKVPYSSFGINIGITYTFKATSKKE